MGCTCPAHHGVGQYDGVKVTQGLLQSSLPWGAAQGPAAARPLLHPRDLQWTRCLLQLKLGMTPVIPSPRTANQNNVRKNEWFGNFCLRRVGS